MLLELGLAVQATEDVRDMDDAVEYAEAAGVPMAELAAPFASGVVLVAGLGLALWRLPRVAIGAVVTVPTVVTLTMHDVWNADEDSRDGERLAVFGTLTILGGALVFRRRAYR